MCKNFNGWILNPARLKKMFSFLLSKIIEINDNVLFDKTVNLKNILKSQKNNDEF